MAQINIRIDDNLKVQADNLFNELGLNMTTAFNMFIRQAVRQQKIPFEIGLNIPNAETVKAIEEGEKLLNDPKAKRFTSIEALLEDLNS